MEDLSLDLDFDGTGFCTTLFGLLDFEKQQQQLNTTPANTRPIAIPPTNPIRPRPKTTNTHTPPTD